MRKHTGLLCSHIHTHLNCSCAGSPMETNVDGECSALIPTSVCICHSAVCVHLTPWLIQWD